MNYQNYIFDLYGTLVDIHTNESNPYLWDKLAQLYSSLGARYDKHELKSQYRNRCDALHKEQTIEHEEIQLTRVFADLFVIKQVTLSPDLVNYIANTFRVLSRKYLRVYPGIQLFLEQLKAEDKKIYLLSNAQTVFSIPEMQLTGMFPYFDGIVMSSDVGICKPNIRIMDYLVDQYHLNPKESIMIGNDKFCDIHLANKYGMDSLYLHTNLSPENDTSIHATYEILDYESNDSLRFHTIDSFLNK